MILKLRLHKLTTLLTLALLGYLSTSGFSEETPRVPQGNPPPNIVFIGNSFMFGACSPVRFFRTQSVTDLNGTGMGGVPAIFKLLASQAHLDFNVHIEAVPSKSIEFHLNERAEVLRKPWDYVVMLGQSVIDRQKPGDPTMLIRSTKEISQLFRSENPKADIRLVATWSRADQVYPESGHWHGKPIEQMALDVRAACELAKTASEPAVRNVIPVGEAWNRAMATGLADPNPYDGVAPKQIDLWGYDHYHASSYGYYLEALMIFGDLTGLSPMSFGKNERAAYELGLSPQQAVALQKVAFDELSATPNREPLKSFTPEKSSRD